VEREIVYLDYAATAAVRPPEVADAVAAYLRDVGATPGRAAHSRSVAAGRVMFQCRRALSELFGHEGDPGRIVFQLNATHALNVAINGVVRPGDAVVRTRYDHNAVRRPVGLLARTGVEERVLSGRRDGGIDLDEARALLAGAGRPARLLVLPHASNVLGSVLPIRELADLAHEAGALVLLDAAQTAGHYPVNVRDLRVDLLAFAGHKGLLGPQGTGGLWVREGVDVTAVVAGGTGADSDSLEMPESYPDHLEAGTQNAPGIAGLLAGVRWVRDRGVDALARREQQLKRELLRRLEAVPGVRIHTPLVGESVGIVLITHERLGAAELAGRLEREHGILTRAGLHCAPEAHQVLGTLETGAVRMSLGWASSIADVELAAAAMVAITGDS
jgi:cysteine desulfurase / selenocysteine lyase